MTARPAPPMSEVEARRVVERVLGAARADQVEVAVSARRGGHTRFADNGVTTAGEVSDLSVSVTASFGTRSGRAASNETGDEALTDVVRRAEAAARLAPEDPEHVAPLEPVEYPDIPAFRPATAAYGPAERAAAVAAAIEEARARDAVIAGFLENRSTAEAIAASTGLFGYHPSTWIEYSNTVRTPDGRGSGWSGVRLHEAAGLDAAARARVAAEKAVASSDPRALEPGDYPVVLEPTAVAVLAGALVGQMDARRAMEGRSYLSAPGGATRVGEPLLAPAITIETDPAHPVVPGHRWTGERLPARPVAWYREGRVETLRYDRYWAAREGVEPVPAATNLILHGEDRSFEELIRGTERAVLVTRLWYIRSLNPRDLTLTGLTRDGTFWIEDGRIAHAVNNFRWNESPVRLFSRVEAMSRPERVADEDWVINPSYVPAVRASSFHFSSVSAAV